MKHFFPIFLLITMPILAQEYTLVFNEDFTDGALDANIWNIEVNGDGGGNNELQYYCEQGVSIEANPYDGKQCLVLTATKQSYQGKGCTSGRVNTKGNLFYTYGRIDARIKFPATANGLWPAFWQMGNDFDDVGWPRCGETDVIELGHQDAFSHGTQDRYFNGAMHVGSAWNTVWSEANAVTWPYSVEDSFHIITMIWTPNTIDMYMDKDAHPENAAYFHANLEPNDDPNYNRSLVFGKPNFIIFNLAVGGNFPGIYNVNQITAFANGPAKMYVDWVRIYQRGDANQSFVSPSLSDDIEPVPDPTDVNNASDAPIVQKVVRNGQILFVCNGKVYDILGNQR